MEHTFDDFKKKTWMHDPLSATGGVTGALKHPAFYDGGLSITTGLGGVSEAWEGINSSTNYMKTLTGAIPLSGVWTESMGYTSRSAVDDVLSTRKCVASVLGSMGMSAMREKMSAVSAYLPTHTTAGIVSNAPSSIPLTISNQFGSQYLTGSVMNDYIPIQTKTAIESMYGLTGSSALDFNAVKTMDTWRVPVSGSAVGLTAGVTAINGFTVDAYPYWQFSSGAFMAKTATDHLQSLTVKPDYLSGAGLTAASLISMNGSAAYKAITDYGMTVPHASMYGSGAALTTSAALDHGVAGSYGSVHSNNYVNGIGYKASDWSNSFASGMGIGSSINDVIKTAIASTGAMYNYQLKDGNSFGMTGTLGSLDSLRTSLIANGLSHSTLGLAKMTDLTKNQTLSGAVISTMGESFWKTDNLYGATRIFPDYGAVYSPSAIKLPTYSEPSVSEEIEVKYTLQFRLGVLNSSLSVSYKGAVAALNRRDADHIRHACVSMRQLLDFFVEKFFTVEQFKQWSGYREDMLKLDQNGVVIGVKRKPAYLFVTRMLNSAPSPTKFLDLLGKFNGGTHHFDENYTLAETIALFRKCEGMLEVLLNAVDASSN